MAKRQNLQPSYVYEAPEKSLGSFAGRLFLRMPLDSDEFGMIAQLDSFDQTVR
jgi:hypothetical protein